MVEGDKQFTIVESPYGSHNELIKLRNILYVRAAVSDSLGRDETPYCSHLFFTQPGILDDTIEAERMKGIYAGFDVGNALPNAKTAVYTDFGISTGMGYGIKAAEKAGREVVKRTLAPGWLEREVDMALHHSDARIWGLTPHIVEELYTVLKK